MIIFQRMQMWGAALLLAVILLLTACGAEPQPARSDGNIVVVYSCNAEDWTASLAKEFQEETGIQVQLVCGTSDELMARVRTEQENPHGDIIWGGTADAYATLTSYLEPYVSPEKSAIQSDFVRRDNAFYNMTMDPYVIAYNTDLVSEADAPKGWRDLLNPKFRGRIALADPTKSPHAYIVLLTMMDALGSDPAIIGQMADQLNGRIIGSSAEQIKALSDGAYAVTATFEEPVLKYITSDAHMKIVYPEEGTTVSSTGIAIIKNAPHTDNAKKFLDFAMSRQVHERLGTYEFRSTRADVSAPSNLRPLSEIHYTRFDTQRAVSFRDEFLSKWRAAVIK